MVLLVFQYFTKWNLEFLLNFDVFALLGVKVLLKDYVAISPMQNIIESTEK